jgi:hypothetical protein
MMTMMMTIITTTMVIVPTGRIVPSGRTDQTIDL